MKKKKLYYLPGMISIIGLPVLLFFWGPADPVNENTIRLCVTADNKKTIVHEAYTKDSLVKSIQNKKMVTLNLNDFVWNDESEYVHQQKINFISTQIQQLQFTNDTSSFLKISFGPLSSYSNVVWVLNQAMIYHLRSYTLNGSDLYLFPNPPEDSRNYATLQTSGQPFEIAGTKPPTGWQKFINTCAYKISAVQYQLDYLFTKQQQNKLIAAGFLLLIVFPGVLKIRNYAKANPVSFTFS